MFRFIIIITFLILYLILSNITWAFLWIFEKFNFKKGRLMGFRNVQWAFKMVIKLAGVKLEVEGLEQVPKDKPVLFIGNHNGIFDTIITYSLCPGITGFISKDDIKKVPLLRHWMTRNYCLFLNRENIREGMKTIVQAIDYINNDEVSIFVFPEGTRSRDHKMIPFKDGSFKIATKTGCPIIPVAITGTAEIFEQQLPKIKKGTVTVKYGAPIIPAEMTAEQLKHPGVYVQDIIASMLPEEYQKAVNGGEE